MKLFLIENFFSTQGVKLLSQVDTLYMGLIEWGSFEDYIKIKVDGDKPSNFLIPIRSNEHVRIENCLFYF